MILSIILPKVSATVGQHFTTERSEWRRQREQVKSEENLRHCISLPTQALLIAVPNLAILSFDVATFSLYVAISSFDVTILSLDVAILLSYNDGFWHLSSIK